MEKNKAHAQAQVQTQHTQVKAQAPVQKAPVQKAPVQIRKNGFSILETLMEEEEATAERLANEKIEAAQKVVAHQQAFPAMGKAKTVAGPAQVSGVSWAALATKPKAQAPAQQAPAQQAPAQQAQAPAQAPKAQAKVVDAPYDDEDPEMLKHFRKTVAVLFQEKEKDQEEDDENTHSTWGCGYSWADE
jgi:hypothetical protein